MVIGEFRIGGGSKAVLLFAAATIVVYGMKAAASLLVPLLFAALIAAATTPVVALLTRKGIPQFIAVAVTVVVVLGGLAGIGALVSVAGSDVTQTLPKLEATAIGAQRGFVVWLQRNGLVRLAASAATFDAREIVGSAVKSLMLEVPGLLSSFGVVLFVVIFILLETTTFRRKLRRALQWFPERFEDIQQTIGEVQKYLFVKTAVSVATGLLCATWCIAVGLGHPVLWGLLAFLLNFVPVFGSVVITLVATLAGFAELGFAGGLGVFAGFFVVNNAIGNIIEPRVLGRALGLSPLVIIVSIVVWGWVLGPVGALLSVPLTMVGKIVLAHTEDLRWVSILLGPGEGKDEEDYAEQRRLSRLSRFSNPPPWSACTAGPSFGHTAAPKPAATRALDSAPTHSDSSRPNAAPSPTDSPSTESTPRECSADCRIPSPDE